MKLLNLPKILLITYTAIILLSQVVLSAGSPYDIAMDYYRDGKLEATVKTLKLLIGKGKGDYESQFLLGNAYYRLGNIKNAIKAYKTSLSLKPGDLDLKNNLANCYMYLNKSKKALSLYEQIYNTGGKTDPALLFNMALVYSATGKKFQSS